jgi:hypothetical protein
MAEKKTESFGSVAEVRSAYYPKSASWLDLEADEAISFPVQLGVEPRASRDSQARREKHSDRTRE